MNLNRLVLALFSLCCLYLPWAAHAEPASNKIGIVLMHGKGGSPGKFVDNLAAALEAQGLLVANIEMPWSGRRDYDADVATAEGEVEAALSGLRAKGAQKVFVAGHSQGGLFALYFGGKHAVDGIIAIAPGGNVAGAAFLDHLKESVEQARKLVSEGKGAEKTRLADFEGSRGRYPVITTPVVYLTWFDPDGAMNQMKAVQSIKQATPVLYIAPTGDYPSLRSSKQKMFDALPSNPHSKLYEPEASHLEAPSASVQQIVAWTREVADAQ